MWYLFFYEIQINQNHQYYKLFLCITILLNLGLLLTYFIIWLKTVNRYKFTLVYCFTLFSIPDQKFESLTNTNFSSNVMIAGY